MTPGARVAAAAAVLDQVIAGNRAEVALTRWARSSRFAGSKDRAAVRDLVFGALRCRRSHAVLGGGETGRGLMIGGLREQGQEPAALLNGEGYALPAITADDAAGDLAASSDAVRWDVPDWIAARLRQDLGHYAEAVALALRQRAPVFLRVNQGKGTIDAAQQSLAAEGIETQRVSNVKTALHVIENERRIRNSVAYSSGLVELQDASSQAAVLELPLRGGMRVLDYCAGGGGKALAIAALTGGRVHAHDALPQRLADLPARAARAEADIEIVDAADLADQAPFDLVLVDAPCSGSGTWRRDPDSKWRLSEAELAARLTLQAEILDKAAGLVRAGGVLAYATCSILDAENGAQVTAFFDRHDGWDEAARRQWMPGATGDGFFLSVLGRAG